MTQTMTLLSAAPQSILDFASEIDTLKFGAGFSCLTDATDFSFGTAKMVGVQRVKTFFVQLHSDMDTVHRVLDVWDGEDTMIVHGEVDTSKKDGNKPTITEPFVWIRYLQPGTGTLSRMIIVAGPIQGESS